MASEWAEYSFADLYSVRSGLSKPAKDFGEGFPFLSFKDVFYNYFLPDELTQLVRSNEKERDGCSIKRGDVFLTRTSETMDELGMSSVARKDYPDATFNGFCKRLRPKTDTPLHPEYVGYFLRSPNFRNEMMAFSTMSTRASLNNDMIGRLKITLPPLPEQKAIAHILGSLDDKIELNRRMNETLEGMAQALFKSWFVDFDPVIDNALEAGNPIPAAFAARARLRQGYAGQAETRRKVPTIGNEISNVRKNFPDSFQTSELGPIPAGWEVSSFGDVASAIRDSVNPSNLDSDVPYVGLEHIGRKQIYLSDWGYAGDVDSNKSAFQKGDVLFGKLRPYFHKVCAMDFDGVCSTDILVFRAKEDQWRGFVQYQLFNEDFVEYANARSTGTRMPRASWKDMVAYPITRPSDDVAAHFTELVSGFNAKAMLNVESSGWLAKLRDTLLPKLISGELRIEDAEKMVGEANPSGSNEE